MRKKLKIIKQAGECEEFKNLVGKEFNDYHGVRSMSYTANETSHSESPIKI